jgi:hypothetical protein
MIHIASINDIHLNGQGLPVFSAMDGSNNTFYPCTLASAFGGFDGRYSHPSLSVGSMVILVSHNDGASFFVIGLLISDTDGVSINVNGIETALDAEALMGRATRANPDVLPAKTTYLRNEDYVEDHVEDIHIELQDSYMNISTPHGLTLQGHPRVSVQIPADPDTACFRVSAGGLAVNKVLNAVPFIDRLFNYITTLEAKVVALENAVVGTLTADALTAFNEGAALNSVVAGSGAVQIALSEDLTAKATTIVSAVIPTPASQIRIDAEAEDCNPYVIIP